MNVNTRNQGKRLQGPTLICSKNLKQHQDWETTASIPKVLTYQKGLELLEE